MTTKPKCALRLLLEQRLIACEEPEESKCYNCYGYTRTCPDFVSLNDLVQNYRAIQEHRKEDGI